MEPIQGDHDKREPILRKITPDSFFPKPHSPFGQGCLPLQWPEILPEPTNVLRRN